MSELSPLPFESDITDLEPLKAWLRSFDSLEELGLELSWYLYGFPNATVSNTFVMWSESLLQGLSLEEDHSLSQAFLLAS